LGEQIALLAARTFRLTDVQARAIEIRLFKFDANKSSLSLDCHVSGGPNASERIENSVTLTAPEFNRALDYL
jgi:hypothetical protein